MAKKRTKKARPVRYGLLWRWVKRAVVWGLAVVTVLVALASFVTPPTTPYMWAEGRRLGGVKYTWVPMEQIPEHVRRAVVAAEDANYCLHWGFDMAGLRAAVASGGAMGGSSISQQLVKNLFLWQGRSWTRKGLEAALTPLVELTWSKRRMLEVYLNIVEFDEGVFGIEAAARRYFGQRASGLTNAQGARLAAILPNPKGRDAARLTASQGRRMRQIQDGAATIAADGRDACFKG
jgi:monofunctional biosynthetic peptidoglycan transglycosylase